MQTSPHWRVQQQGAATLLITLVLTMSITIVTLAVARTQLVEQRISNNENWNTRLSLQAESGLARGIIYLNSSVANLPWSTGNDNTETSRTTLAAARPDIGIDLMFSRAIDFNRMISVQAVQLRLQPVQARL